MEVYAKIVERIIKQQESIIGPVAVEQAQQVRNLDIDWKNHKVAVKGDGAKVIDDLVDQYKDLFGKISVEVCKEAAEPFMNQLPAGKLPKALA